ncbi:MAG: DNA polymerase III subunit gamma/tau [Ruminococcaceae bacterium]|nr:DNA polymerase III subunit gamma/tau [Oscillospiraceae bacterium]
MHRALYRKWRPMVFEDVVGQEHITRVLSYEVANKRVNHAYLFCGSRGIGKTTCAKILAKAINCESPKNGSPCGECVFCKAIENGTTTDVLEMDAASNTGVDYIRDIKNEVMYSPSLVKNRVYIIDEVHMLTDSAFNALLKTLEEPPENVVFILATTEKQKIPATILSRCQKFDFKRVSVDDISNRLKYIADKEGIVMEEEASRLIAKLSQGGLRDAISLLELCSADSDKISYNDVAKASGCVGRQECFKTVNALVNSDHNTLFEIVADIYYSSSDISAFWNELMSFYRDLLVIKSTKKESEKIRKDILDLTKNEYSEMTELAAKMTKETMLYHAGLLEEAYINFVGRQGTDKRLFAEMTLIKMTEPGSSVSNDAISARLSGLEAKIAAMGIGKFVPAAETKDNKQNNKAIENPAAAEKSSPEVKEKNAAAHREDEIDEEEPSSTKGQIDGWSEILALYRENNSSSAPFLEEANATIDDSCVVEIVVESSIGKMMLDMDNASAIIGNLITSRGILVDRVIIRVKEESKTSSDNDVF